MYSFLRRPLWILSHVLIAILIVVLVSLGFWQRSRYYEERNKQDELEAAANADPVPLATIGLTGTTIGDVPPDVAYTRVEVSGEYDVDNEVLINNRSLDGSPGAWVLTPLVSGGIEDRADSTAVAVVRGWVPLPVAEDGVPVAAAPPPSGDVTITGVIQLSQERGSIGPIDPPDGHLDELARVDLERLGAQLPYGLAPVWVLSDQGGATGTGDLPLQVSLQPGDPSQNFSYMFQWWIFAAIAIIGYPLIIRSVARTRRSSGGRRRRERLPDEIPWAEGLGPDGDGAGCGRADDSESGDDSG